MVQQSAKYSNENKSKHNRISKIVLASSSPRRQELVAGLGLKLPLELNPTYVDESYEPGTAPNQIVRQLSLRKARAAGEMIKQTLSAGQRALIIGSDTIVVKDQEVLGKPKDEADAHRMLTKLQGSKHQVFTGLAVIAVSRDNEIEVDVEQNGSIGNVFYEGVTGSFELHKHDELPFEAIGHTMSEVTFRQMSEQEIADYIASGYPLDKAGAYGIQGIGAMFIERLEGDFYSVMGLPVNMLYMMLKCFEVSPFHD